MQTCTLLTANRPSAVGHLYRFVTRGVEKNGQLLNHLHIPSAVNKAALMRESALKSVIFVGVPRVRYYISYTSNLASCTFQVILSLAALHEALDSEVKQSLRTQSRRFASPIGHILPRCISTRGFCSLTSETFLLIRAATPENIESTMKRGRALWDSIYAPHADKLHDKLGSYHPDFICEYTFPTI